LVGHSYQSNYSKRELFDKMNKYCEEKETGKKRRRPVILALRQSVALWVVGQSVALINQIIQNKNNFIK
jgi:hypothetical protein